MIGEHWPDRIADVIADGGPDIVYQPIVNLWNNNVLGWEALSRFPEGTPAEWFHAAHLTGQHVELEISAARKAILQTLKRLPLGQYLAVNVCAEVIRRRAELARQTESSFRTFTEYDYAKLVLEVTETERVEDEHYPDVLAEMGYLRSMGVRVSIDDVGAGWSTFRHVLQLAPDMIKLDRSLIAGIDSREAEDKRALVASMCSFAARVNTRMVVEGVETWSECRTLRDLGVRKGQGWRYGRPGPIPLQVPRRIDVDDSDCEGGS